MNAQKLLEMAGYPVRSKATAVLIYHQMVEDLIHRHPNNTVIQGLELLPLHIVEDDLLSRDGRNFIARLIKTNGLTTMEFKVTPATHLPDNEYRDILRHELAHAYVRAAKVGKDHDQIWQQTFILFGGSGKLSPWCTD